MFSLHVEHQATLQHPRQMGISRFLAQSSLQDWDFFVRRHRMAMQMAWAKIILYKYLKAPGPVLKDRNCTYFIVHTPDIGKPGSEDV